MYEIIGIVSTVALAVLLLIYGLTLEHKRDNLANRRSKQAACDQHEWERVITSGSFYYSCRKCGKYLDDPGPGAWWRNYGSHE